jgi:glycosyltransferase involved in cell wall biosynthesis
LRILIIVSETPPITSGVARCSDHLITGLRGLGHEVDVVSSLDVPRKCFGEFRFSAFVAHWPRIARKLAGYDLVNVHGPVPTFSDAFLGLAQLFHPLRRPPIVYTHHCTIDLPEWGSACRAYNRVHRTLASQADRIVTTTDAYAELMATAGGPPVTVIPWGVEYTRFHRLRPVPQPPVGPLRILFVGQMRAYKGVETLLRAIGGDARLALTLVGGGPLEHYYRQEAVRLGAHNACFLGRVSDSELENLYGEHDAIALPSTSQAEAFGLVLLEGMAAGCVPVAASLPGVADIAGPSGLLVRPGDAEDLRQAFLSLATDPGSVWHLGRASQERARAMGWDRTLRSYEELFRDVVLEWRDRHAVAALPSDWLPPEEVLASVGARFGASWGSLLLFTGSRRVSVRAGWGNVEPESLHANAPRIAAYVAQTGQPVLLDPDHAPPAIRPRLIRDEIASALSVPIRSGRGRLVLNLAIARDEARTYSERDLVSLVRFVAPWVRPAQLALPVTHSRL